jgi:hypothetical protein
LTTLAIARAAYNSKTSKIIRSNFVEAINPINLVKGAYNEIKKPFQYVNNHPEIAIAIVAIPPEAAIVILGGSSRNISTPHGPAIQSIAIEAKTTFGQIRSGSPVYRQGTIGTQHTTNAQYWSLQNPTVTKGYSNKMGMPNGGSGEPWIMKGSVKPSSKVITREAPGIGKNTGGDIEAVTQPEGVAIDWFHMP